MHELPFVMRLLAETDEIARENRMDRIRRIRVEVGALSGIVPECVSLYFESASEGHAAEGAELEFTEDPAILRCAECGREFPHEPGQAHVTGRDPFDCPVCGGPGILVKGTGSGSRLLSVEG